MADKYILRVTAGPSYDASTHVVLPVNTSESTLVKSPHCTSRIKVRVQNYRGLPRSSPTTSPYFSDPSHIHDQYSVSFEFIPHESLSGDALLFGNDFDRPVRDRLPPGFGSAFRIAKWVIDPGLEGDLYADKPYLYSPLIATITRLSIGARARRRIEQSGKSSVENEDGPADEGYEIEEDDDDDEIIEEGADDEEGEEVRKEKGMPESASERKTWGLREKENWVWEGGRAYSGDFFNPYLDFNTFSLKLPGFSLSMVGHLGGEDCLRRSHDLRYVLKNKDTGDVYFVVVFTLLLKEDVEKGESIKAQEEASEAASQDKHKEEEPEGFQPGADDLD